MKISGFTVIRNAEIMGYPVVESIRSLLPLVDELVVGVGQSDDQTKQLIQNIGDLKIKVFDAFWDIKNSKGGLLLSEKTNEALARCENDWCFYLQADEVLHQEDYPAIRQSLERYSTDPNVQGFLFRYIHFYGSYQTIATARNWYRHEIRLVKKSSGIQSHNDAQGFRVHGQKPYVVDMQARIFHYGWVKPPEQMGVKSKLLSRLWHGNEKDDQFQNFSYDIPFGLRKFTDTHPEVMKQLVAAQSWKWEPRKSLSSWTLKDVNHLASHVFEKIFRFRIGEYKNYRLLK